MTGAGGFIGSHVAADQARRGSHVVALDLDLTKVRHLSAPGRFDLLEGDLTNPRVLERAVRGVDVILHLAAAHRSVRAGKRRYWRVNVEGVQQLTDLAGRCGVGRFVHCSSVGVFGTVSQPPASEQTPCHPETTYERTKAAGEKVVLAALREQGGLEAVVLRPAWVYGPGCPRTEKLFRAIGNSSFLMAGPGDRFRHCVYIRDMVDAFELASVAPGAVGQVIIVGDRQAVLVRDLLRQIAELTGAKPPRSVPVWLLHIAGLTAEMTYRVLPGEPPISRRTVKFFTANTSFDITRARKLLGWEPKYDLSRGLRETHQILTSPSSWRVPLPVAPAL